MKKDYRLYILLRNDLQSMGSGRAAAQASHASNAFIHKFGYGTKGRSEAVLRWQRQTNQGFGTAVVLACNWTTLRGVKNSVPTRLKDYVVDPDYVVRVTHEIARLLDGNTKFLNNSADDKTIAFTRSEITCAYIFGDKEELEPYLGALPLYTVHE